MKREVKNGKGFSIFDPAIRFEHREFYERIISELNGIFPVCNQGESTAVEISENATEQEQITELMKRVENFSDELLDVTKKLFDQYYVAKEALNQSILNTTAYNKINTLDRNLLERTCDVRWWALETAFSSCITAVDQCEEEALTVGEAIHGATVKTKDKDETQKSRGKGDAEAYTTLLKPFYEDQDDSEMDIRVTIVEMLRDFSQLLKYDRLGAFIDLFKKFCADNAPADGPLKKKCSGFAEHLQSLHEKICFACDRLEDINNSYTLYRDLVITNRQGIVVANSNKDRRQFVLGLSVGNEEWFQKALLKKRHGIFRTGHKQIIG